MSKKNKVLSLILSAILLLGSLPCIGVNAATAPYITSDTNTNVVLAVPDDYDCGIGIYPVEYVVKFTVHGSSEAPVVKVGNSKLVTAKLIKKNGNDYFYKIKVVNNVKFIGTSGYSFMFKNKKDADSAYAYPSQEAIDAGKKKPTGATGVYVALPSQQYKCPFVVSVKNFDQLYPQPEYGAILYDNQMPQHTYWIWGEVHYRQKYNDGKWIPQFSYSSLGGVNESNVKQYEAALEAKFPDVANNLPTDVPKNEDDNIREAHTLYVYLGEPGPILTTYW